MTLFSNPQDSDIVLQLREDKIYAHRVVLRLWSPFFNKALMSNFAVSPLKHLYDNIADFVTKVATNPVFELDDQDDDLEAIIAVVKHMYGMKYNEHAQNTVHPQKVGVWRHSPVLRSDLAVYTMADKYDCRAVRRAALESFKATLHRIKSQPFLIHYYLPIIAYVCGSEAPRLADQSLYNAIIEFFFNEHVELKRWRGYRDAIRRDDVFDAHCTRKLMDAELIESMRLSLDDVD
ncbi:unnamed protein product [Aureobasidium mustum]|uniref:BTB domain-containing protein n=1 Tax=Aureobasidium mustum TaxID=2773714 RepID=A0A9N8PP37_9PEZI|nr:unnamed protein product [Aureobasidium mustum]